MMSHYDGKTKYNETIKTGQGTKLFLHFKADIVPDICLYMYNKLFVYNYRRNYATLKFPFFIY